MKLKGNEIYTNLDDQVTDPETEVAIYNCLAVYIESEKDSKNFSKFLTCLNNYVDFDSLKKYVIQ